MSGERLHLGCGSARLEEWINIDIRPYPGVDRVLDVRQGLPFDGAAYIFAEHFIEHFDLDEGIALLRECRRVLAPGGVLRLTTPNLDWVWTTSYATRWTPLAPTRAAIDTEAWPHDASAARDCIALNRAFRAWGHRFLYNAAMLRDALRRAGFASVEWREYGASGHDALRGIERHERSPETAALPHLLIAEASGHAAYASEVEDALAGYLRDLRID